MNRIEHATVVHSSPGYPGDINCTYNGKSHSFYRATIALDGACNVRAYSALPHFIQSFDIETTYVGTTSNFMF